MKDEYIILYTVLAVVLILFFSMFIDLRDHYEQRFQIVFCDSREPINMYIISKDLVSIWSVKTQTRQKTGHNQFDHFSITPTLEFYDSNTKRKLKFINVCDIVEMEQPKLYVKK